MRAAGHVPLRLLGLSVLPGALTAAGVADAAKLRRWLHHHQRSESFVERLAVVRRPVFLTRRAATPERRRVLDFPPANLGTSGLLRGDVALRTAFVRAE